MSQKSSSKEVMEIIKKAIMAGNFDWTNQTGIIIYTPAHEDIKYIVVDFKVTNHA